MKVALPYNWHLASLIDLVVSRKGKRPKVLFKTQNENFVPYLDIKAIEKNEIDFYANPGDFRIVNENEILIVWDGARSGLAGKGKHGIAGSTFMVITPIIINTDYLFRFFQSQYLFLNANTKGSGIPHVNGNIFWNIQVPIPPIDEQVKIVDKLERTILKIENSINSIIKAQKTIPEFTNSIYSSAISGSLSKQFRAKNKNKSLKGIKDYSIDSFELEIDITNFPVDWKITNLESISEFIGSGITPKGGNSTYTKSGIPFIRSQNVYPEGIILENIAHISKKQHSKMQRTQIKPKDVLLNITGNSIGRSAVVPDNFGEANVNQHVCILRFNSDLIFPDFIALYLNSPIGQEIINASQKGTTRKGLNYRQVRSIPIPIPHIEEQKLIVKEAEKLIQDYSKQINSHVLILKDLNEMKQATYNKAFSGKLVKQNQNEKSANILEEIYNQKIKIIEEFNTQEKLKRMSKNKDIKKFEEVESLDQLLQVMKSNSKEITPFQLWEACNKMEIDKFYELLKKGKKENKILQEIQEINGEILEDSFILKLI